MPEENIGKNKEWLVNRIENFLKNCSDELLLERQSFKVTSSDHLSLYTDVRIDILGAASVGATIIVGLATVEPIKNYWSQLLIVIIFLGLAGFALTNFLKSKASKEIDKIDLAYLQMVNNLFQVNGFVVSVTSGLEKISIEQLKVLFYYSMIVYGNRDGLFKAFENASKSILLRKNEYVKYAKKEKGQMDKAIRIFRTYKEELRTEKNFLKNLSLDLTNPLLERYNESR